MYYLFINESGKKQIISDKIFEGGKILWNYCEPIKNILMQYNALYYIGLDNQKYFAGEVVKYSENKLDLVAEGIKIKYDGKWYTVKTMEGLDGLFIAISKPVEDVYDRAYVKIYTRVEKLVQNKIEDIKCE